MHRLDVIVPIGGSHPGFANLADVEIDWSRPVELFHVLWKIHDLTQNNTGHRPSLDGNAPFPSENHAYGLGGSATDVRDRYDRIA
jgi:hypothetical protein